MNIYEEWKNATLSQFWGKKILRGIMRAISEELQAVYAIQQQIRSLTNIDIQEGVNLDNIGDIVCLSREDAQEILLKNENFEMTDESYRKVLKYIIALHNSSATYYDIINGIELIWNLDDVQYSEDRNRAATYILNLGEREINDDEAVDTRTMTIRAAGVKALYLIAWILRTMHQNWKTRVALVEYKAAVSFFGGIRRIDGSLLLNGSYRLDAAAEGKGQVEYLLKPGTFPHSTHVGSVYDIPYRLIVSPGIDYFRVTTREAAVTGIQGNSLTVSLVGDCLALSSGGEPVIEDSAYGLRVTGTQERSVCADDYLVSSKELYGEFQEDGLLIHYASDVEFSIEITSVKIF